MLWGLELKLTSLLSILCGIIAGMATVLYVWLHKRRRGADRWLPVDKLDDHYWHDEPVVQKVQKLGPLDGSGSKLFYLSRVEIKNICCFEELDLAFETSHANLTTLVLGDNSTGKSTILRSIAIGLCPESEAVSLMKDLKGRFLRDGTNKGWIRIHLRSADRKHMGTIETAIFRSNDIEKVRQTTIPSKFPWDRVFVCGYGTYRTAEASESFEGYRPMDALSTLFNDSERLQNPEVVLSRDSHVRERLIKVLQNILLLEMQDNLLEQTKKGVFLSGPWGKQLLTSISDGYRSTVQWVIDFLTWHIHAEHTIHRESLAGILLIDELEQHLHPRWQRHILQRIRAQFPYVQLISTTHTPLIASAMADLNCSQILRMRIEEKGGISVRSLDPKSLIGKRADQVLSSAFDMITSKSPASASAIARYATLAAKDRGHEEEIEYNLLRDKLGLESGLGENEYQQVVMVK